MDAVKWTANSISAADGADARIMSRVNVAAARCFHQSFPQYAETPLAALNALAGFYGVKNIFVKDESFRFGLNAFKVLGGSYAMARCLADFTGRPAESLTYDVITSPEFRKESGELTFFSATDGNHGRGVAWSARMLKQKAVILMPKGTQRSRFENIRKEGAEVTIEDLNYDGCVRKAAKKAKETPNGVLIQDTAWDGYEEIPSRIMQGYGTMAAEADEQFLEAAGAFPTHVFIQAGVGSLAAAVAGYFADKYGAAAPRVTVVEADQADCIYRSALANDGSIRTVGGAMHTMMAGLACGEPSTTAWRILKAYASAFASVPDAAAAVGMRVLGAPLPGDPRVISGESGAAPAGLLHLMMTEKYLEPLRRALDINKYSRILLFSTEGATDPENYRRVVWEGTDGYGD
ncbi:MAG: diaminopropionate ammonia-lyase [Synergistes sp.]|nr:diaminopropionate ammonia-lyase [Synergistes sp.]